MEQISNTRRESRSDVVCIEGNGSRPSHHGDGYIVSDIMYTLNSTEVHAVAYDVYCVDMGGGKSNCIVTHGISPTLTTTHYGEPVVAYER